MRYPIRFLVALVLVACAGETPTEMRRPAPPTLSVSATTRVIAETDSSLALEVSATLRNGTGVHIQVSVGPTCPLFVRLLWNPTGEFANYTSSSMACPRGGPTLDLAPGDTTVLTRMLGADTLATFAPGTYGVNVAVTTSTGLLGVWAGAVQLPLATPP
jgi:hypothetical protein